MIQTNLYVIISALILVLLIAITGVYFVPSAKELVKELATLAMGGLLAIMRPSSQVRP